jgi:hypothetical protein
MGEDAHVLSCLALIFCLCEKRIRRSRTGVSYALPAFFAQGIGGVRSSHA